MSHYSLDVYTSHGCGENEPTMDGARGALLPIATGFRLKDRSQGWMQYQVVERLVKVPAKELR